MGPAAAAQPVLPILQQVQDERMERLRVPLPSFPRKRESGGGWPPGVISQYRRDSRLRGKDGSGAAGNGGRG